MLAFNFNPMFVGGSPPKTRTFKGCYTPNSATNQTSKQFDNVDIGTPGAGRMVAVAVIYRTGGTVSSVTINGVAATAVVAETSVSTRRGAIYRAAVPSGTTVTVTVVFTTAQSDDTCGILVWDIQNLASQTPVSQNSAGSTGATNLDANLSSTTAGGIAIGAAMMDSEGFTEVWTGLTQDGADQFTIGLFGLSAASRANLPGGSLSINFNSGAGSDAMFVMTASWA